MSKAILVLAIVGQCFLYAEESHALREARFRNPPADMRLLPIHHSRPDSLARADAEVDELIDLGYGGMVVNAPGGDGYLVTTNGWSTFSHVVRKCREKGLRLSLYDENGYPSGSAGDLVLKGHPEWAASGMLTVWADGAGGETVRLKLPPGKHMRTFACPLVEGRPDGTKALLMTAQATNGEVAVVLPAGKLRWRALSVSIGVIYEGSHASCNISRRAKYPNLLMREPTERFIEVTHETYARKLGSDLSAFASTFSDEPSLMSFWFTPMPYIPLPWSEELSTAYRQETGRDVLDDVPFLAFANVGGKSRKYCHRFWKMVADRVSENYFGQLRQWCRQHGLQSGGHLLFEEALSAHVGLYGDFFRCLRTFDEPGIDCLTSLPSGVPWRIARFASSAAALNGTRRVMCEVSDHVQRWRAQGDTRPIRYVTEDEIIGTLKMLAWGGVNVFTSYYVFDRIDASARRRINLAAGRVGTLMTEGTDASDVAVLYPSDALMATYEPSCHYGGGGENAAVAATFCAASDALFAAGRPFMFVDADSLSKANVSAGELVFNDLRWRAVVLPRTVVLAPSVLEKLLAFKQAGGLVIAIDEIPSASEGQRRRSEQLFGTDALDGRTSRSCDKQGGLGVFLSGSDKSQLATLINDHVPFPFAAMSGDLAGRFLWAHRRTSTEDIWMIVNRSDEAWNGSIAAGTAKGPVRLWNVRNGTSKLIEGSAVDLELPPWGVAILTGKIPMQAPKQQ